MGVSWNHTTRLVDNSFGGSSSFCAQSFIMIELLNLDLLNDMMAIIDKHMENALVGHI